MKRRQIFAAAAASLIIASMMTALPVSAAGDTGTNYEAILTTDEANKTTSFDKYLVMDKEANVPNAAFNYTIAPGAAIAADTATGKLAVLAGIGTPAFKTDTDVAVDADNKATVSFKTTDTTTDEENVSNKTVVFSTTGNGNTTDEKFAEKTITLDFSAVPFTEPGVYRYVITETGENQGVTNDSVLKRTLDVYVEDDTTTDDETGVTTKQLKITGYVMYSDEIDTAPNAAVGEGKIETDIPNGAEAGTKSDSYTNTYATYDLTFSKEVTGNQGSKDKYFKFTVLIENAVSGTVYDVDLTNADATSGTNAATVADNQSKTNPATITVETDGTVSTDFYLQHGQSIEIKGLAEGTKYTITEAPEDYTPTAEVTGDTKTGDKETDGTEITLANNAISDDWIKDDTEVAFTNDRSGVIPTGVILSVAGPAVVGIAVISGIITLTVRRKKNEAED